MIEHRLESHFTAFLLICCFSKFSGTCLKRISRYVQIICVSFLLLVPLWLGTLYCEQKDCFRRKRMGGCRGKTEGISYLSAWERHEMQRTDLKATLGRLVRIVWKEAVIMTWLDLWSFKTHCGWICATFPVSSQNSSPFLTFFPLHAATHLMMLILHLFLKSVFFFSILVIFCKVEQNTTLFFKFLKLFWSTHYCFINQNLFFTSAFADGWCCCLGCGNLDSGGEEWLLESAGFQHICCLSIYPHPGWQLSGGYRFPRLLCCH